MEKSPAGKFQLEPPFTSFDHLVGAGEQRRRHVEAEHSGDLGVDDQLELGRLLDRQVRRLSALEDAACDDAELMIGICEARAIAHQPAGFDMLAHRNDVGIAWRAASAASWTRRLVKNPSGATNRASGRASTRAANAASISRLVLALKICICSPMPRAAGSTSASVDDVLTVLLGFISIATRTAAGTSSRRSPSRFAFTSAVKKLIPVALLPGRARLATRPSLTGSSGTLKAIGSVCVAALAATAAPLPDAAIALTCRRTRSAASSGNRSSRSPAKRYSIATFCPSTFPVSARPRRNASKRCPPDPSSRGLRNPITGIVGCCARATTGHAAAAPPSSVMNSRRFTR